MTHELYRPDNRRAQQLRDQMHDMRLDYECAMDEGRFSVAADLKDALRDMEHALFLTGAHLEQDDD